MDDRRFDTLTRLFARPASRRRTLTGVVATALVPLAASAQPEPAKCLAEGKRCRLASQDQQQGHGKDTGNGGKGKRRRSCAKCCSRYGAPGPDGKPRCACKPEGEACEQPAQCCGGLCRNGACTKCPNNLTACAGDCVDLQTDNQHCGDCATACASGQRCVGGQCVCDGTSCPRGCCAKDGSCQRGTDDQACGIDGADCQTCGTCTTCDGTQCAAQSGVCCGDHAVCQNGTCRACGDSTPDCTSRDGCVCNAASCGAGKLCCGSTCVPNDTKNCGACGAACRGATPDCDGTQCVCNATSCGAGELCCGGKCVANDASNCGGCGTVCAGETPDCDGTTCVCNAASCGAGKLCCGGKCIPSDTKNCGACGTACSGATPDCNGTTCICNQTSCGSGEFCCDGKCVANDANHCGGCNVACSGTTPECNGTTCVVCTPPSDSCHHLVECYGNPNCVCDMKTNGEPSCDEKELPPHSKHCSTDNDCDPGQVCIVITGCGSASLCATPCAPPSGAIVKTKRTRRTANGTSRAVNRLRP